MKPNVVLIGVGILALLLAVVLFAAQPMLAVLAVLIGIAATFIATIKRGGTPAAAEPTEIMDPESRALYVPIKRVVREIEDLVEKNAGSALVRTLGKESLEEAIRIRAQIARALAIRSDLRRSRRGKSMAEREIAELEAKRDAATTETEREALSGAVQARKLEVGHYSTIDDALVKIDANVRQAEAALSEIRARLAVALSGGKAEEVDTSGDLRESLTRLEALSVSVDEAEQLLRG